MNDEQSKRLAEAAEAVLRATDALDEARAAFDDKRFESEQERVRLQAAQQVVSRLDAAAKRVDDGLRKAAVASAALAREGGYARFREARAALQQGQTAAAESINEDGIAAKRARAEEALGMLEGALAGAAALVFGGG